MMFRIITVLRIMIHKTPTEIRFSVGVVLLKLMKQLFKF